MSAWRKKAIEILPELKQVIESSKSPTDLWIELYTIFEESIRTNKNKLTSNILLFLGWCTSEEAGDVSNETHQAAYCGFLEDITLNKQYYPLFKSWFNAAQFEKFKGSFQYSLSEKEFKILESEFYGK